MGIKPRSGIGRGTFMETKMVMSPAYLNLGLPGSSPVTTKASIHVLIRLLLKRQFSMGKKKGQKRWERSDNNSFSLTERGLDN